MKNSIKIVIFGIGLVMITGCTTLHTAASTGKVKSIDQLIEDGEDINECDNAGLTPLMYAIRLNQMKSFMALLNGGADVNRTDCSMGNTPLHEAVLSGNSTYVRILLTHNADGAVRNKAGKTALDIAKEKNKLYTIQLLSEHPLIKSDSKDESHTSVVESKIKVESVEETQDSVQEAVKKNMPEPVVQKNRSKMSDAEATVTLERMIKGRETLAIRAFLNDNPDMLDLIKEPKQRIRYVGPSGWRVMDIIEGMRRGTLKEENIITHITQAKLPYENFTSEEREILSRYGIPNTVINAMIGVSH